MRQKDTDMYLNNQSKSLLYSDKSNCFTFYTYKMSPTLNWIMVSIVNITLLQAHCQLSLWATTLFDQKQIQQKCKPLLRVYSNIKLPVRRHSANRNLKRKSRLWSRERKKEKVFSSQKIIWRRSRKEGAFNNRWTVFLNQVPNIKHLASFSTRPFLGTKQFQHNSRNWEVRVDSNEWVC